MGDLLSSTMLPQLQGIDAPSAPRPTADATRAREAAEEFEAMFITQMLQPMFAGIETDPNFGGGGGETMFRSLLVDEYGKILARSGGIGIADQVQKEILKMQEVR